MQCVPFNYLLNRAEYDNNVTSPMPSANDVKTTPIIAKYSWSVFAIKRKLVMFSAITESMR